MGLRKMTVDVATMSSNPRVYEDKESRFRFNTSGYTEGIRELIEKNISSWLRGQPNLHSDTNEVFSRLLVKLEEANEDFDPDINKTGDVRQYIFQNLNWIKQEIYTEKENRKGDDYHDRFITEEDRSSEETTQRTTEEELFHSGHYEEIDDDLYFDEQEARQLLVETLDLLKVCESTLMVSDTNKVNALRFIQAELAHARYVEEEIKLEKTYSDTGVDSQVFKAKRSFDLSVSYGLSVTSNFKHVLKKRISEDYISSGRLYTAYKNLLRACHKLTIPIIELDADKIMTDEYIRELRILLNRKNTVCITEYDLEEFEIEVTPIDIKKQELRKQLIEEGVSPKRILHYFDENVLSDLSRLKASEFRKLDTIVEKVKHSDNLYKKEYKFANHREGDKHVNKIMEESEEFKRRVRTVHTTLLTGYGYHNDKRGFVELKGVFSEESLRHIKSSTTRFFNQMLFDDPEQIRKLYQLVQDKVIAPSQRKIVADGNGFLKYEDNGFYFHLISDEFGARGSENDRFIFNKWLINEKGFIVSKFLDAEAKVKEDLKVYRTPNQRGLEGLIIKTITGKMILNGVKEDV